jgi:uncharacterized protein (TIGR03435 family)
MKRASFYLALMTLASVNAFSQSPAFDVADIHVSAKTTYAGMSGGALRGSRYEIRHASMLELITTAYGIDAEKVLGGPTWLEFDRFDVIAKAPPSTSPENLRLMLQGLLADRFKLVVRMDSKPIPAFILSLGKGKPKIKESEGSGPTGCQTPDVPTQPGVIPLNLATCHNVTMKELVRALREFANGYITTIAVDQTGPKGGDDFDIKWTGRGQLAQAGADGISLFDASDKQLGLKLESGKIAQPVMIVDSASNKPTPNPSGVAPSLPAAPPAEFDVAEIKPTMPGVNGTNINLANGRLDVEGATLKLLIRLAWDFNTDDLIAAGPKSLDTTRWSIVAKTSAAAPEYSRSIRHRYVATDAPQSPDRPIQAANAYGRPACHAYTLSAIKPKLQKADPLGRTGWKEGPPPARTQARGAKAPAAGARDRSCGGEAGKLTAFRCQG